MRGLKRIGIQNLIKQALVLMVVMVGLPSIAAAEEWLAASADELRQRLHTIIADDTAPCDDPRIAIDAAMVRFYQVRAFKPAWVDRYGLRPEGAKALATVYQAADQGLHYADYRNSWLENLLDGTLSRPVALGAGFEGQQIQLDLVVTEVVLRYAWHVTAGRTNSDIRNFGLPMSKPAISRLAVELAEALDRGALSDYLSGLGPRHDGYRVLRHSLARYRQIRREGGWPTIDKGLKLKTGDCGVRVDQLKQRLAVSGDYRLRDDRSAACFDADLRRAVARFQRRHGLVPDGVVGERTSDALNVPVRERIRQIQLNLERWRGMPASLGSRYLMVNIPAFQMEVVEGGRVIDTMRTVVGRNSRPTPLLASRITYLEINPYWHVPHKIARKDLLPKIKADPGFLVRQDFRVFDGWAPNARELDPATVDWAAVSAGNFRYRLRQEPSGRNALGRVKFMFPNEMSVYLHDTPSKGHFKKTVRSYSSGCVRVEDPLALVSILLRAQGWDPERLAGAVASDRRQVVVLDDPMPVYLVYLTAWVDAEGRNHFREDIYGHDHVLAKALDQFTAVQTACRSSSRSLADARGHGDFRRPM
ncbi:MAG: L,D-transpeptidase family protein [Desulfobacterales bacterium]|nr:L,D-transpeptidase family protein [Desulfobacterales bacterium]